MALRIAYAPVDDDHPDPGEVVWAWVPYEDDPSQGKDRPVLVIGTFDDGRIGVLAMTTQDHDRDAEQEAEEGRYWMDIGAGDWDSERRPSEVRLNRLIDLDPKSVRREGVALDKQIFAQVVDAVRVYLADSRI